MRERKRERERERERERGSAKILGTIPASASSELCLRRTSLHEILLLRSTIFIFIFLLRDSCLKKEYVTGACE